MNHLRRMVSFLLVLVLCFGLIPGVSAAEVDTPGVESQTEAAETEETLPPNTEDTTPTEETLPEESVPDAESTESPAEDVPQDGPGIIGLSPGDSSTWAIGSTQNSIMLFDYADNGNYTTLTEVRTDNGYVMLKQGIDVVISRKDTADSCGIYGTDVLGLIQNDPQYASIIHNNGDLHNMPQKHLEHKLLTASATVDGKKVTMLEDNGSANAEAPLTVVNTRGFDLPKTGDNGTMMITLAGVLLMAGSVTVLLILNKKKLH